jgi:hypothetical protein
MSDATRNASSPAVVLVHACARADAVFEIGGVTK